MTATPLHEIARDLWSAELDESIHYFACPSRRAGERCQSCLDHAARVTDLSRQADRLAGVRG